MAPLRGGAAPAPTPLYASPLYDCQRRFYTDGGVGVFESTVPSFITTNAFVAHQLATLVLHAWRDLAGAGALDPRRPVTVLELGAGSGRLGSLLARELLRRAPAARVDPALVRYVMTDLSPEQAAGWVGNPAIAELVERGTMRLGVAELGGAAAGPTAQPVVVRALGADGALGAVLPLGGAGCNPVVVVATYLFDSLPMDVLRVDYPGWLGGGGEGGGGGDAAARTPARRRPALPLPPGGATLRRGLVAVDLGSATDRSAADGGSSAAADENAAAGALARMPPPEWSYSPHLDVAAPYPPDEWGGTAPARRLNDIAGWYASRGGETTLEGGYAPPRGSPMFDPTAAEAEEDEDDDDEEEEEEEGGGGSPTAPPRARTRRPAVPHATVPIPVGALTALEGLLAACAPSGFLLLTIDKGLSCPAAYACAGEPELHIRGSFSLMVNFHALQLWAAAAGGDALVTPDDDVNVKVAALLLVPAPAAAAAAGGATAPPPHPAPAMLSFARDAPLFCDTFTTSVAQFGPSEFYDLQRECTVGGRPAWGQGARGGSAGGAPEGVVDSEDDGTEQGGDDGGGGSDADAASYAGADTDSDDSHNPGERPMFVTSDSDGSDDDDDGECATGGRARGAARGGPHPAGDPASSNVGDRGGGDGGAPRRRGVAVGHYADGSTAVVHGVHAGSGQLAFARRRPKRGTASPGGDAAAGVAPPLAAAAPPHRLLPASHQPPLASVRGAVALLRLARWDPDVFVPYRDALGRRLRYLTPPRRLQVGAGLAALTDAFFPVPGSALDVDVPFHVGRLLQRAGAHLPALRAFRASWTAVGPHPATAFAIGEASAALGQPAHAAHWLRTAIGLAPGGRHPPARRALRRLQLTEAAEGRGK